MDLFATERKHDLGSRAFMFPEVTCITTVGLVPVNSMCKARVGVGLFHNATADHDPDLFFLIMKSKFSCGICASLLCVQGRHLQKDLTPMVEHTAQKYTE